MWLLRYLFFSVMLGVFGVVVLLFLGQNQRIEQLNFFGLEYTTNLVWVLLGAAAIGVLVTLVLLLPGRLAGTVHGWSLEREVRQLEQGLARLQEQRERVLARHELLLETHERVLQSYQRLVAEYGRVAAERDRVRSQLAAMEAASASVAAKSAKAAATPVTIREHAAAPHLAIVAPAAAGAAVTAVVRSHPRNSHPIAASPGHAAAPEPIARPAVAPSHMHGVPAAVEPDADCPAPSAPPTSPAPSAPPAAAERATTAIEPMFIPVAARQAEVTPVEDASPAHVAPAATPAPPDAAEPLPPTMPALPSSLPVPAAPASVNPPAPSVPPASASDNDSVPLTQQMATQLEHVRGRLHEGIAGMATLLAAKRVILDAKLARLRRSVLPGDPSSAISGGTPSDQQSSDD
ncbi:MAG TPA: LapA family protein [Ktedonobacterales bacterium]|nr:LapA family protein [Ktedonobacterales bacterium]